MGSTNSHQEGTKSNDRSTGTTFRTLSGQRQSMARRHKPRHDTPHSETTTQTIWTLQNHQHNIQSGLSIGTATPMEDSQRVPRFPPIALSQNDNARAQLPRATPRRHRRGEGVGSEGNRGIKT